MVNTRMVSTTDPQEYYSIEPEHDILHVALKGTWNMDVTNGFIAEFKKVVSRYFAREWAYVLDLRSMDMMLPEEEQINAFRALNTWCFIKGLKSMALLVNDSIRPHLLYQFEEVINEKPSFNSIVLSNPIEARHWLKDEGFIEREIFQSPKTAMIG